MHHSGRSWSLSYVDVSPAEPRWDTPVLFVHGAAGHLVQWCNQLDYFSTRCRTLALDLRGHGLSETPEWPAYHAEDFCQDLELFLDHLGVTGPVALVAHSYGGAAATLFALKNPDRVERLVLLSTAGKLQIRRTVLWLLKLPEFLLQPVQRLASNQVGAPAHVLKKLVPNVSAWRGWELYPGLKAPVLAMCGELDRLTHPKAVRRMAESIPGAHYEGISFAAHLPQLERSRRVNEALCHFLQPHDLRQGGLPF